MPSNFPIGSLYARFDSTDHGLSIPDSRKKLHHAINFDLQSRLTTPSPPNFAINKAPCVAKTTMKRHAQPCKRASMPVQSKKTATESKIFLFRGRVSVTHGPLKQYSGIGSLKIFNS